MEFRRCTRSATAAKRQALLFSVLDTVDEFILTLKLVDASKLAGTCRRLRGIHLCP